MLFLLLLCGCAGNKSFAFGVSSETKQKCAFEPSHHKKINFLSCGCAGVVKQNSRFGGPKQVLVQTGQPQELLA